MFIYHVDEELFKYLTKASGHTLQEAADAMGIPLSSLYLRLNETVPFKGTEIASWANLTSCTDLLTVFYKQVEA